MTSIAAPQIAKQRAEVLEAALGEHLALLSQVAREEEDQEDLRELAGLELERPDVDPELHAVDSLAEPRNGREQEEEDRRDSEQVAVRLEHAVVVAQRDQRRREDADADQDPERLAPAVVGVEPVVDAKAERREHRGERKQRTVGVRRRPPHDDVRRQIEAEEDGSVADRARRDLGLAGDRDARERGSGDHAGDEDAAELPVPRRHRTAR